jgi:glycosyltransferase involved in cell wall biosynthesis
MKVVSAMNILVFADLVGNGGTEQAFRVLVDELMQDNHYVQLITSRPTPGYNHVLIPEAFSENPLLWTPHIVTGKIMQVLAGRNFDVVVYGLMFNYGVVRIVQRHKIPALRYLHVTSSVCPNNQKYRFGQKKVCTENFGVHCVVQRRRRGCDFDGGLKQYSLLGFMRSLVMNYASRYWDSKLDKIIANSEYVQTLYVQCGYPQHKLALSYPPNRFLGVHTEPLVTPNTPVVLFSGRLEEVKGLKEVQQILTRLPQNAELHIAGVGGKVEELLRFATDNGLRNKLVCLGFIDDARLKEELQSATVCVVPSHLPETYGLSGAEAIALGTPVVAYDVGGVSEWLVNHIQGRLVPPESPDKFVEAVLEVLACPWRVDRDAHVITPGRRYVSEFYQQLSAVQKTRGDDRHEISAAGVYHSQQL